MPHGKKHGLYENIRLKRQRIASGKTNEKMRKANSPGAPSNKNFADAAETAKKPKKKKSMMSQYA